MGGGGKKRRSSPSGGSQPETEPTPAIGPIVIQPFATGYDALLAQQLSQGFGGTPQDFLTDFEQFYRPMNIPGYPPPKRGD